VGLTIVLLLCGGDKSTQQVDIHKAKTYRLDYAFAGRGASRLGSHAGAWEP